MFHTSVHLSADTTSPITSATTPSITAAAPDSASAPAAIAAGSLPLDVAEHAFELLMCGPAPLSIDGAALGQGLPARPIPLNELRQILLHPSCSRATRDYVWRHLLAQARAHRNAWMVAAVALAIPMLRRLVGALVGKTPSGRIDREDLEAEVLAAYMEAVTRVKLTWSHPLLRLSRMTQLAVLRIVAVEPPRLLDDPESIERAGSSHALAYPAGHSDLLLDQAVADGIISEAAAELIQFTRLEGIPLTSYCRRRGLLYCTALKRRQRAEAALHQAFLKRNQ
ncbi:hypothetical protein ACIBG7_27245 [Nonomuraea sp. NPDC050328]|uniref:hypothetical protein n=1 Tax=Nonomuraea sp. NPDC050328 TaxID=3364361 RepID=UPI0037A5970E